ncbi:indolepyruvate ferredoxin oxidoreductase family protein [Microbaculum marinisediminis]|uniref:Indolepyruvate ferredoxin oxidoreductase family protein n=1 Tax=Microbaculum marinisediminis TaxID=2931392 RepID=A0AAW5QZB4_9HYPH|nr:indolepyruvate ferredoxin oxidoreductase family protein [Microbaculum sp. A6E488]MCT8971615.1 indolepyruvate ferredoxin oxidoreductase family protein [Microbaculum sp. A6E488]
MALKPVTLDDKYDLSKDQVFVSGTQAVLRLCLMQKERDRRDGFNTAGYVTGYRGSPLGGLDQTFGRAKTLLQQSDVVFQPGLNEDLAATALWGAQQAELRGQGAFDGVFGIWYGKGPGVDRTGDVFRHANFAGSAPRGGVLALMGDDHTCESSTTAHQSEFAFVDAMIPILSPAGVQEILDYGVHGWALSRYAGTWCGIKCVKDTIESTAIVDGRVDRVEIKTPTDFEMPPGGLNIRIGDHPITQEARLHDFKRYAILAYLRANKLDKIVMQGGKTPKIGIATAGKSYLDVRQALEDLGIDEVKAAKLGIRLFKVACPWPLEPEGVKRFADGLDLIIVVEEKRSLIETQLKEQLYGTGKAPVIVGKHNETGGWLFPSKGALDPNDIAIAIGERVLSVRKDKDVAARLDEIRAFQKVLADTQDVASRTPYFCAGCPHNTSTVVPEGSHAYAGIGCHFMAQWMDRHTEGFTQMGGEGANWIGEAPFSKRGHVFQNLGDGTYNHSGYLALRAAAASGVNVTYKILFNDAVAMTGGQRHEGGLTVPQIAAQVTAEGAKKVVIVTDEPDKYPTGTEFPAGVTIHHRSELDAVQKTLREIPGLTVLIYDQTCAAEKRRRRKRGQFPDPQKRIFINELVCEGCGDCGVQSNCVAIQPVETEFGRKRQIDQSSCNKDYSCIKGFCPSFVTVEGGRLKKGKRNTVGETDFPDFPTPDLPQIDGTYDVVVTGVGGTGVVTIGALIGMAAHLEGKACGIIDMAGLAQKGGSVLTHLKIAEDLDSISAIRVSAGAAELVLGCDIVVAGTKKVLASMRPGRTEVVINTHAAYPGDLTHNANFSLPIERLKRAIRGQAGQGHVHTVDATGLATALLGDSILGNIFMLGYAYQLGRLPLSAEALEKAIALNGVAVADNVAAFRWGRWAAIDADAVEALAEPGRDADPLHDIATNLDEIIDRRAAFLTGYQNAAYAERYRARVERVRAAEQAVKSGETALTEAVARYLFKLMAYKDEYEVARLYTDGTFAKAIADTFEGDYKLKFHLAPPLLNKPDPATGRPEKSVYGPWMMKGFRMLATLKGLRGTAFDIFGYSHERRMERQLIADYEATLDEVVSRLDAARHTTALALVSVPEKIRGYGPVKERNLTAARAEWTALAEAFRSGAAAARQAAE